MPLRQPIIRWFVLGSAFAILANVFAVCITRFTFDAMGEVSAFAIAVRAHDLPLIRTFNLIAFPASIFLVLMYEWPVFTYLWYGAGSPPPPSVQRCILSTPLVVALIGLFPWVVGCVLFPFLTWRDFGHWSGELASQHIISPLLGAFMAATTSYLLLDWLFRWRVAPVVFPSGRLADVRGALVLGVRSRLLVFLLASAFAPLFTMYGLIRAAVVRADAGVPLNSIMAILDRAGGATFAAFVVADWLLAILFARTLTQPLVDIAAALRRVATGDLNQGVSVSASDEVGVVQDGVNAMVAALHDREHILQVFGRAVEPSVRDRLIRGDLLLGGESRHATVLFCDLRGFTSYAEGTPAHEVVSTLNEFFTVMTVWVRECGGTVDKFIGDALLVVFGLFDVPAQEPLHAAAAVRCALGMRDKLAALNRSRAARNHPPLDITVTVHTGDVVAGRIGAVDRHEYTVIGDTVNIASRLQTFGKEAGEQVVVSEDAWLHAQRAGCEVTYKRRATVSLRGRREPVSVLVPA